MLGVGKALLRRRNDVTYPGAPGCPVESADTLDVDWLPVVAGRGWAVLMRDKRIRRRPGERSAFIDHGVVAFVFTGAGNLTKWQQISLLVKHWGTIDALAGNGEPGPRMYRVTQASVEQIPLDPAPGGG